MCLDGWQTFDVWCVAFALLFKVFHDNILLLADDCICTVHVVISLNC